MKRFSFYFVILFVGFFSVLINAQTWEVQIAPGLTLFSDPMMIFSAVDHNICWGIENYELGNGITNPKFAITTDGGINWNVASAQIPSGSGVEAIYARDAQTAWIAVYNPNNGDSSGIYKTTNIGVSWQKQGSAFSGGSHPMIIYFFNRSDTGICIGSPINSRFETYKSTDGGEHWIYNSNLPQVDGGDIFPVSNTGSGNTFLFGTFLRKIYKSTDRGVTWTKINYTAAPSGAGVDIKLKDGSNGLACTYFGDHINRVAKTTDGGMTWSSQPLPPSQPSFYFLSYVPGTSGMYLVTSHNNYSWNDEFTTPGSAYTLDNGQTWSIIDNKPHGPASFSDDGWGWSSGIGDTIYRISKDVLPVELTSFTANAQDSKVILNWVTSTEINNLGFEIQRKYVASDFATIGFVNGEGSTTNQKEYSYIDKDLTDGKYSYRLKQIDYNGAYEYSNTIEVDVRTLDNFSLEQNYPNPFNPTTTIGYVLQEKSNAKLTVMNAIGEEVAVLVNGEQDKGFHKAELDGKNLSSGIYFYKLQAGSFVETKKMLLLK